MKILLLMAILTTAAPTFSQNESVSIGAIDFYGHQGLDLETVRAALPIKQGDQLSRDSKEKIVGEIKEKIKRTIGREPSDVSIFCCDDRGRLTVYIGLSGARTLYNPVPRGSVRLSPAALKVYREADQAWLNAMKKGVMGEDDSRGFALSVDPEARAKQLAVHTYVARHATQVRRVLESARDTEQRQIAAELLGYANRSGEQIRALVRASHDVDDGVRNNAIRALTVLARSSSEAAASIPAACFIDLLNSPFWTDRNKSAALLSALTARRDPRLFACLREQALTSLVEMARWSYSGHAYTARLVLGRMAGLDDRTIIAMHERQEVEPIINALTTQQDDKGTRSRPCTGCFVREGFLPLRH